MENTKNGNRTRRKSNNGNNSGNLKVVYPEKKYKPHLESFQKIRKDKHLISDFEKHVNGEGLDSNVPFAKKSKEEKVVSALAVMNSESLISVPNDDDLIEFFDYFIQEYENNEKVLEAIYENWPESPRIFRLAGEAKRRVFMNDMDLQYKRLPSDKKQMIEKLVEYLFSRPCGYMISLTYGNDDTDGYFVKPGEKRENREIARNEARAACTRLLIEGGSAVIRYHFDKSKKEKVCGIYSEGQCFFTLPAEFMKECMEAQPEGHREFPNDVYEEADISF